MRILRQSLSSMQFAALHMAETGTKRDIDIAILSKMERGERRLTKEIVQKLAKIYGHDADELQVLFLSDKILYEVQDEEFGMEALKVAEEKMNYITRNKKKK